MNQCWLVVIWTLKNTSHWNLNKNMIFIDEFRFENMVAIFSRTQCDEKKNEAVQSVNVWSHWGWVMHICFDNLTINASDHGLSPGQCQATIWTTAGILLIGTNFSEILIEIHTFSFKKMHLNMLPGKCLPFCLRLNVLSVEAGWVAGGWGWGWVVVGINESRHLLI